MPKFDNLTKVAIKHTRHCLTGCGIGEVVGMLIASSLGWHRAGRFSLAIALAFIIGYSLTYRGIRKDAGSAKEAIRATVATDTVSIVSMEVVDNVIEFLIPNAMVVTATSIRFWWGLALALIVAFIVTVPVNRLMMSRGSSHHHAH